MDARDSHILSIDSLEIGYGSRNRQKKLLPPLNAAADKGELVAVIGRNGIGKSTLLRTIVGLQLSFGGKIMINGENLSGITRLELARKVGYISTEIIKVSNMKVCDLVALGRFPHTNWIGRIDGRSSDAIDDAISKTGMSRLAGRYIAELSDGERQRVMIARVLAQDAEIMIMDEPTAFLDLPGKYEIVNLIRNLSHAGKTIIFSTHDINIALKMSDRIWVILKDGLIEGSPVEILENGSLASMFESAESGTDPSHGTFTKDYLKYFL